MSQDWDDFAEKYKSSNSKAQAEQWSKLTDDQRKYVQDKYELSPPPPRTGMSSNTKGCLVIIAVVVVLGFCVSIFDTDRESSSPETPTTTPTQTETKESSKRIMPGDNVVLRWADAETAGFLAINDEAWDQMFEAINAKDPIGLQALISAGAVYNVRSGTKARVLDIGFTSYKVRLMDGPNAGIAGWVVREFVQPN